jgi:hypothetical protein
VRLPAARLSLGLLRTLAGAWSLSLHAQVDQRARLVATLGAAAGETERTIARSPRLMPGIELGLSRRF